MKNKFKLFLLVPLLCILCNCFSQSHIIDNIIVLNSQTKEHYYLFNDLILSDGEGNLETEYIYIFIQAAKYNMKSKVMSLKGRVCLHKDEKNNCVEGSGETKIFYGKKIKNVVTDTTQLQFTSYDRNDYKKEGFFKIQFKLKEGYYLYFDSPSNTYVEEFSMTKMLTNLRKYTKQTH